MTEPREPTLKQWKRRALVAEERAEFVQNLRNIFGEKHVWIS